MNYPRKLKCVSACLWSNIITVTVNITLEHKISKCCIHQTAEESRRQKFRPPNGQYLGNRQVWHTDRTDRRKKLRLNLGSPDKNVSQNFTSVTVLIKLNISINSRPIDFKFCTLLLLTNPNKLCDTKCCLDTSI